MQYITSAKVQEVYFTGMFTSNQGDLSVHYYDPESGRIRQYYPDFLAKMADGSYQLIEVKGDNKIDDATSVFSTQIRRKLEFSNIIHCNNSTVGLCASAVWVYSHAVLLK